MILYHGSTQPVESPRVITTEYGRDFGAGFYTTDLLGQARRWALRKARIASRQGSDAQAVVSRYEFDEKDYGKLKVALCLFAVSGGNGVLAAGEANSRRHADPL